jgi:hypothetical protein
MSKNPVEFIVYKGEKEERFDAPLMIDGTRCNSYWCLAEEESYSGKDICGVCEQPCHPQCLHPTKWQIKHCGCRMAEEIEVTKRMIEHRVTDPRPDLKILDKLTHSRNGRARFVAT